MTHELERAVRDARRRLESTRYQDRDAWLSLHDAERRLAAARGEQWAEPIDLGVTWDAGAPLPHFLSNGSVGVLICRASVPDPHWDGTSVRIVSPADSQPADLLQFTFVGCHSAKFGGPNDEVLHGHPLSGRGLDGYGPHVVHNSVWLAEEERINSAHDFHRPAAYAALQHYFFVFHDEMFEALAADVHAEIMHGKLADHLVQAARRIVDQ